MKRYKHNLSNYQLLTGSMGGLYPIACREVLPGDTFQQSSSALIRLSPQVAPVMHPVQVRIHHFFVPNRILWNGWEDFITGGPDGLGSTETWPELPSTGLAKDLLDYLGIPPVSGVNINAMPIRAYNKIFNEFYRDQDLIPEVSEDQTSVLNCAWEKDYFTSSRPFTQKGPAVTLGVGARAPVVGLARNGVQATGTLVSTKDGSSELSSEFRDVFAPVSEEYPTVYADLSDAEALDVNEFRRAFALQRYQEARAQYGSRFTEYLRYLGVRPADARLQRPEYLGGGKQTISFSEVLRTGLESASTSETAVVGELKGHGIAAVRSNRYRKFFEEHGWTISLMSVRPKTVYTNGVHRKFTKKTKEEFWQKELEQIGQQEIYNSEIFAQGAAVDQEVFGYNDRYREYKEEPSVVTSEFRDTLDYWHLARSFSSAPVLNQSFVECIPTKRIFANQADDPLWIMVNNKIRARRMVRKGNSNRII